MKKTILKGAAMLLGGVLLGTLLMIAAYAIPSETVWENVRVSAQTLANEGLRYEAIGGYHASRLDDFTDAIMIGNAVLTTEDPVESAMTARHFTGGETIGTLMRYLDGEDVPTESYARYWHGYLAALKPLLMVMNLNSIRVLNMYAQLALVLWTAALMVRRGLLRHVLALFAAYASLCPAAVMQSLQYSTAFLCRFRRDGRSALDGRADERRAVFHGGRHADQFCRFSDLPHCNAGPAAGGAHGAAAEAGEAVWLGGFCENLFELGNRLRGHVERKMAHGGAADRAECVCGSRKRDG